MQEPNLVNVLKEHTAFGQSPDIIEETVLNNTITEPKEYESCGQALMTDTQGDRRTMSNSYKNSNTSSQHQLETESEVPTGSDFSCDIPVIGESQESPSGLPATCWDDEEYEEDTEE